MRENVYAEWVGDTGDGREKNYYRWEKPETIDFQVLAVVLELIVGYKILCQNFGQTCSLVWVVGTVNFFFHSPML